MSSIAEVVSAEEIREQFQSYGVIVANLDVVDKLREMCIVYKVSALDLCEYWFAFCTSNGLDSEPTVKTLAKLENDEFKVKRRRIPQPQWSVPPDATPNSYQYFKNASPDLDELAKECQRIDEEDCYLLEAYGTPDICAANKKRQRTPDSSTSASKKYSSDGQSRMRSSWAGASPLSIHASQSPSNNSLTRPCSRTPSASYASRTNAGDVVCVFGEWQLSEADWRQPTAFSESVAVKPYDPNTVVADRYKYMYLKLSLISTILDDRIDEMAAVIRATYETENLFDVSQQTAEEVTVVGRVSCDGNGRLNPSSVTLQGSLATSKGCRIQLDVSKLSAYSLFPGQIVALSGTNNTGQRFVASKLHPSTVPSFPFGISPSFPDDFLSIVVAAGPYMTSDSVSYEPLCDLLKMVDEQKPHVCILIGPFVDAKQKQIEEANFLETYDNLFASCMELILSCSRGSSTQFVIIPSARDIHHDFVYPTAPFSCSKSYKNEKNLHFASDPSILNIAGVAVGISSTDVLMHLSREEISFPSMPDRLGRLASHLLLQRSFYPIYPPAEEMAIDYEKLETMGRISVTPHVLILPSDLTAFVKDVQGCCCVNPQRLTRGTSGGTFAQFRIRSVSTAELPSSSSIVSRVACRVLRI